MGGEAEMCSLAALARGCRPAAKPCCLCWCCCCSCSCLAARGSEGGPGKKPREPGPQDPLLNDDAPPSLEEIQSWGQSFDRLMRSAAGRKVFRDFLRGEYSEENIMFWLACEELKRETDPDAVEEKARFIYEDYISILSPKEVSLDSRVREVVNRNMVEPTPHTFDEAQLQIYTLMHRDSYPRFVNSPLYKTLAHLTSSPAASPQ
ncbi:regulator of G-protein signaling 20 isoform X2 [Leguminivora glycinivorella]|uniref:regulator of G-protein signaling 20 isoform X2 n=2 Tax=Leguminivora glycinivorella TaxID=1035111 RepID=UPI00200CC031|nr:regulator of G-protein signaling 20 isoform X2 [Leguminivora glycinivorella]